MLFSYKVLKLQKLESENEDIWNSFVAGGEDMCVFCCNVGVFLMISIDFTHKKNLKNIFAGFFSSCVGYNEKIYDDEHYDLF